MIQIFNRSHYEDVIVPKVTGTMSKSDLKKRYTDINNFELLLANNNTYVLKFYLNISRSEQRRKLEERLKNPQKYWKHKDHAPRHIIPADDSWRRVYQILTIIVDTMEKKMKLKWPKLQSERFDDD
jgi:polyphosphate kinase 2 (PPK2 family)